MWLSLPFLYLFLQGYCYILLLSWLPGRRSDRRRPRSSPLVVEDGGATGA